MQHDATKAKGSPAPIRLAGADTSAWVHALGSRYPTNEYTGKRPGYYLFSTLSSASRLQLVDDSQPTLDTQPHAAKPTAAEVKLAYEYFGILPGTKLEDMLGPICASPISVRKLVRKGLLMLEETMEHSSLGRQRLKSDAEAENKEAQSLAAALLAAHAATLPKTVPSPLSSMSPLPPY